MLMTYDEMVSNLKNGICFVEFTKISGESRQMNCTLNFDFIPEVFYPKNPENPAQKNEQIIKVFDLDKEGWRSFYVSSVFNFQAVKEKFDIEG